MYTRRSMRAATRALVIPSSQGWCGMPRFHVPTLGALAVAACALASAEARAQETIDCGQAACVQFSPETPTKLLTGATQILYINYRFLNGSYTYTHPVTNQPIGARIVFESSDYFLGTGTIFSNDVWSGSCELIQSNPWKIRCEWVREPWVQDAAENSVENVWIPVRSQRGDTPDGYVATFQARVETQRTVDASPLIDSDERAIVVDGEANLRLESLARGNGGYGYIPDGQGGFIPGRRHRLVFQPGNYIRTSDFSETPAWSWPEYDPPLTDPDHFDQTIVDRYGGNRLEEVVTDVVIPDWVYFYGVSFASGVFHDEAGEGNNGWIIETAPTRGTLGGALRLTFDQTGSYPLLASGNATTWYQTASGTSYSTPSVAIDVLVPCSRLPITDADPDNAIFDFPDTLGSGQVVASGLERIVSPLGTPDAFVTHTVKYPQGEGDNWLFSYGMDLTGCGADGVPINSKVDDFERANGSRTGPGVNLTWTLLYRPSPSVLAHGETAVVDFLPPFTALFSALPQHVQSDPDGNGAFAQLGAAYAPAISGEEGDPAFGEPWFCILPRTEVVPDWDLQVDGDCADDASNLRLCGNGLCEYPESTITCEADCGSRCGDAFCASDEDATSCPDDCTLSSGTVICGDGTCTTGEALRCPADCPAVCGDIRCTHDETPKTCAADCGTFCHYGAAREYRHVATPDSPWLPDPMQMDPTTPWTPGDPYGAVGWNPDLRTGCISAAEVCNPRVVDNVWTHFALGDPECEGKLVVPSEITALLWRTDHPASDEVDGWANPCSLSGENPPAGCAANTEPLPPGLFRWRFLLTNQRPPSEVGVVNTRNFARLSGGLFDPDGATGPLAPRNLEEHTYPDGTDSDGDPDPYPAILNHLLNIDSRPQLQSDVTVNTTIQQSGNAGWIGMEFYSSIADAEDVRLTLRLPPGFQPAPVPNLTAPPMVSERITPIPNQAFWMAPVVIGDNGAGLTPGTIEGAVRVYPNACVPSLGSLGLDESSVTTTAEWVEDADPLKSYWQVHITFTHPEPVFFRACHYQNRTIEVGLAHRPGYPFVQNQNYRGYSVIRAANYDGPDDDKTVDDPDDYRIVGIDVQVPQTAGVEVVVRPTCVEGSTLPSFVMNYRNIGGVTVYGTTAIFNVPRFTGDGRQVVFRGLFEPPGTAPPGTTHFTEITTSTTPPLDQATQWQDLATYLGLGGDPAAVRAVRIRYEDAAVAANALPAWYDDAEVRIDLDVIDLEPAAIGDTIVTNALVRAVTLPYSTGNDSNPAYLGECPATLTVHKYLDPDRSDSQSADPASEPDLAGWQLDLGFDPGTSLDFPSDRVDNAPKLVTTAADGTATVQVWPGQIVTATERLPAPQAIELAPTYPGTFATLTWQHTFGDPTAPPARTLGPLGFEASHTMTSFGNTCECTSDNLCVEVDCVPPPSPSVAGQAATCSVVDLVPAQTCNQDTDVCESEAGACDPATGACAYEHVPCAPDDDVPTRVYAIVDDTEGAPVGSIACDFDHDAATLTCETELVEGVEVLKVRPELTCGGAR